MTNNVRTRPAQAATSTWAAMLRARALHGQGRVAGIGRSLAPAPRGEPMFGAALRLAPVFRRAGVRSGDHAIIAGTKPTEIWAAYLACAALGAVPVISPFRATLEDPQASATRLEQVRDTIGREAFVLGPPRLAEALSAPARFVSMEPDPTAVSAEAPWLFPAASDEDIAHLQLTSGSTDQPRVVAVSHGALANNVAAINRDLEITSDDVYVSWLPLYHDLGLVGTCLAALYGDASLFLLSPFDFLRDPLSWLRAVSAVRGTVSCAPDFALRQVARRAEQTPLAGLDLSCWRRLVCGGEPVQAESVRGFAAALKSAQFDAASVVPSYGLAEATVYVSTCPPRRSPRRVVVAAEDLVQLEQVEVLADGGVLAASRPADRSLLEVMSVGPRASVAFAVVDQRGVPLPERSCGEVVVTGPSVAAGYFAPSGELDAFNPNGLPTGDIGFMHDGELFLVDRLKNTIIRNGENYSAQALEEALGRVLDVSPSAVLVVDVLRSANPLLVALIEADADTDIDSCVAALRAGAGSLPLPIHEMRFLSPRGLPRTTSGKKQHAEVRRLIHEDGMPELRRVTLRDAHCAVPEEAMALGEQLDVDEIDRAHRLLAMVRDMAAERGSTLEVTFESSLRGDLDIDSLDLFELAVKIEAQFDVAFDDDVLDGVQRVADLVAITQAAVRKGRPGSGLTEAAQRFAAEVPGIGLRVVAQKSRQLLVDDRWVADFASCNYLGFDLDPEIQSAVGPMVEQWGTHPSWTRAVASPEPYGRLERGLAELVGAPDTVVFPTVTLLHFGVLPRLAGPQGAILLDSAVHHSVQEAAALAQSRGASVTTWRHGDLDDLDRVLSKQQGRQQRIIAVDGVYSMSGEILDLPGVIDVAAAHDAVVYVDDAHGIGLLGARPSPATPYGHGGGGVARHFDVAYERVVYVGGLSKAFSSMASFVTCTAGFERPFFESASTMVFSGPIPVASLATALAGLDVNQRRGDVARRRIQRLTRRLVDGLSAAGFDLSGHSGFPIVNVVLGDPDTVLAALHHVWQAGLVVTPSVFPAAPLQRGGVRFTVTAANTEDEIDVAVQAMASLRPSVRGRQLSATSKG